MDARTLVGMTEGAKKRAAIYNCVGRCIRKAVKLTWFKCWNRDFHARVPTIDDDMTNRKYQTLRRLFYVGQRLRPCPGCPSCTDSSRLQVIGYVRRIGGRVRIDRTLDVSGQSAFYVIIFSWRHEGPMQRLRGFETKQLAWEHLQEYWGYRGHLPRLCDGSGVLPARAKKVRR